MGAQSCLQYAYSQSSQSRDEVTNSTFGTRHCHILYIHLFAPSFSEPHDTREERKRTETAADHIDMKLNPVYDIHTTNMCTSTCSGDYQVAQ